MESVKLSSKYQITLPRKVREDIRARKGDRIIFVKDRGQWVIMKVPDSPVEALKYLGRKARLGGTAGEVHREMEEWEG